MRFIFQSAFCLIISFFDLLLVSVKLEQLRVHIVSYCISKVISDRYLASLAVPSLNQGFKRIILNSIGLILDRLITILKDDLDQFKRLKSIRRLVPYIF